MLRSARLGRRLSRYQARAQVSTGPSTWRAVPDILTDQQEPGQGSPTSLAHSVAQSSGVDRMTARVGRTVAFQPGAPWQVKTILARPYLNQGVHNLNLLVLPRHRAARRGRLLLWVRQGSQGVHGRCDRCPAIFYEVKSDMSVDSKREASTCERPCSKRWETH